MPEVRKIAYFALDVPHKGQASFVHINEVVENLRRLGWHVDLFAPEPAPSGQPRSLFVTMQKFVGTIRRAVRNLSRYHVVYVRAHPGAWPLVFWARKQGLVVVEEINGTDIDVVVTHRWLAAGRPLVRWLYTSQYRMADHLFPVAKELGEWLRQQVGHDRITVVPNAANTDLFHPIERAVTTPFVVFFGGLTAWHGVDMMLDAVRHRCWPAGVELVIIGTGAYQASVEAAVQSGLSVRWLGYQPYEQIPQLIAGAIAGLIPITDPLGRSSTGTGMHPLKLYETLASGLPAIVTDLPGQSDIVRQEQCGLVVPCGDARALAEAVARLAGDPHLARDMGRRGAAFVQAGHSWAKRAAQISAVLEACLASPKYHKPLH